MSPELSRRNFLKAVAGSVAAVGAAQWVPAQGKDLIPHRRLGKTGASVSILGLGGGSNFLAAAKDEDEALHLLQTCLEGGVNYYDTASSYGKSEHYYGPFVKANRDRIFLATKTDARSRDDALRSVETSLKNLQTDHLDLIQIHSIVPGDTVEKLTGSEGAFTALQQLKEQKVVRFVGITGHTSAVAMRALVENLDGLDTALFPINAARDERDMRAGQGKWRTPDPENPNGHMEEDLLPACARRGVGVIAMKTTACGFLIGEGPGKASAESLIRYTLSVPHVSVAIVGPGSLEHLRENIDLAQHFQPMSEAERRTLTAQLAGTLPHLAYRQPEHRDAVD